jgi:hypothetical protein
MSPDNEKTLLNNFRSYITKLESSYMLDLAAAAFHEISSKIWGDGMVLSSSEINFPRRLVFLLSRSATNTHSSLVNKHRERGSQICLDLLDTTLLCLDCDEYGDTYCAYCPIESRKMVTAD